MAIPKDGIDRLKNAAFWYWEYQRRNKLYRRWSIVIKMYIDYFDSIDELQYINSLDGFEEAIEQEYDGDTLHDMYDTPYCRYLVETHGPESKLKYIKLSSLSFNFDRRFKRVFRYHWDGMDTTEALQSVLNKEDISFETDGIADLSAMLAMHEEWIIQIDGEAPSHVISLGEASASLPFNPELKPEQLKNIGPEYQVLNMFNKAFKEEFEDQFLDNATVEAAYKLSIAGRHINNADLVRLAVLWMWDRACEWDPEDVEAGFQEALEALQAKLDSKGMGAEKAFNQFFTRRKRILDYFRATNKCIEEMNVFNLNS